MKKYWKIIIGACLGLVLGTMVGRMPLPAGLKIEPVLSNTFEFSIAEAAELELIYHSEAVYLRESSTDQIIVEEYKNNPAKKSDPKVTKSEGKVKIAAYKPPGIGIYSAYTNIYLPKDYEGVLKIRTDSGEISGEIPLHLSKFQVDSLSGSMEFSEIIAEDMSAGNQSGSIELKKVKADMEIKNESGNVDIGEFSGNALIESDSGKVKLDCTDNIDEVNIKTSSGSIKMWVPGKLHFYFFASTQSGRVQTFFKEDMKIEKEKGTYQAEVGEDAHALIELSSGSGGIKVNQKK